MPDFTKNIDPAFKPTFNNQTTGGPNAQGQEQTWQNPRPQLDESSAQQLAKMLGATLVPVTYSGGPYAQDKPQYQLQFAGDPDLHDASMLYDRYQRSPGTFQDNLRDEIKSSSSPSVSRMEADARLKAGTVPGGAPGAPGAPGGGFNPNPNAPGPNWKQPGPVNSPGPTWKMDPLPGLPQGPAVIKSPGTGVQTPGSVTVPPLFSGEFPMPIDLNDPERLQRQRAAGLLNASRQAGGLLR